jgi:hypothetical protein
MKKDLKIIKKLTNKVGASLALLKNGTNSSVVLIAADKVGLITVLGSKGSSAPLNLGLNFTTLTPSPISFFIKKYDWLGYYKDYPVGMKNRGKNK